MDGDFFLLRQLRQKLSEHFCFLLLWKKLLTLSHIMAREAKKLKLPGSSGFCSCLGGRQQLTLSPLVWRAVLSDVLCVTHDQAPVAGGGGE